ncbi:MAG: class I SAM-dependent methyltransferase [Eubacteriales bacterium]|nr:class I SAM-dependent methyltransferase [Eubacteriales bacterium]
MAVSDMKERTEKYFDSTAAYYDNSADGRFVKCMYREILDRADRIPAEKILDLGCGNGNVIALLKERKKARYYGVDISEEMVKEAQKRLGETAAVMVGDAENLPFDNDFFDLIICNASFHHYPDHQKAVEEMKRVLRPGGTIILGDPTVPGKILVRILNFIIKYSNSGDAKIWCKKEITRLFQNNGFQIENWKKINYKTFMFQAVLK